jgi:hypothetical protein
MPLERVPRAVPQQAQDCLLLPLQSLQQSSLLLHIWFIGISVVRKYPWHKSYCRTIRNLVDRATAIVVHTLRLAWIEEHCQRAWAWVWFLPSPLLFWRLALYHEKPRMNPPSVHQAKPNRHLSCLPPLAKSPHPQALLPRTRDIQNYHCIHVRGILALGRILLGVECKTAVTVGEDSKVRKW